MDFDNNKLDEFEEEVARGWKDALNDLRGKLSNFAWFSSAERARKDAASEQKAA